MVVRETLITLINRRNPFDRAKHTKKKVAEGCADLHVLTRPDLHIFDCVEDSVCHLPLTPPASLGTHDGDTGVKDLRKPLRSDSVTTPPLATGRVRWSSDPPEVREFLCTSSAKPRLSAVHRTQSAPYGCSRVHGKKTPTPAARQVGWLPHNLLPLPPLPYSISALIGSYVSVSWRRRSKSPLHRPAPPRVE